MERKFEEFKLLFSKNEIDYDKIYDCFQGWFAYAECGNTYKLRKKVGNEIEQYFPNQISSIEINRWLKIINTSQWVIIFCYSLSDKSMLVFIWGK